MKEGPNIAAIGALVGDPARANILTALMAGKALTATELSNECGLTPQTVSAHLAKLQGGGLLRQRKQGRHRYFSLSGDDVGELLETMMGLAASRGHVRTRTGPKDPELRKARICYDHLAGDHGVAMLEAMLAKGLLEECGDERELLLTDSGRDKLIQLAIDLPSLEAKRRPLCRSCLDWSARRSHLAGSLGAAMLARIVSSGWARRQSGTRLLQFTPAGERALASMFDT